MEHQHHIYYLNMQLRKLSPTDPEVQLSPSTPSKVSKLFYYRVFFNQFELLEIEDSVYTHFSLMLRTINNRLTQDKKTTSPERFKELVAASFFISLKYLMDDYNIYLSDFARMGKINIDVLEQTELFLLIDLLKGDIHYDERAYSMELDRLLKN